MGVIEVERDFVGLVVLVPLLVPETLLVVLFVPDPLLVVLLVELCVIVPDFDDDEVLVGVGLGVGARDRVTD